jgi:hypothetical protein
MQCRGLEWVGNTNLLFAIMEWKGKILPFQGRWHSREKRLLVSSCPSVCLSACISATPTGRIFVKFLIFGTFVKIRRESPDLLKIGKKLSGALHEDLSRFDCYRRHEITTKSLFSSKRVSGCYDSRGGINITRTRHNVNITLCCVTCLTLLESNMKVIKILSADSKIETVKHRRIQTDRQTDRQTRAHTHTHTQSLVIP